MSFFEILLDVTAIAALFTLIAPWKSQSARLASDAGIASGNTPVSKSEPVPVVVPAVEAPTEAQELAVEPVLAYAAREMAPEVVLVVPVDGPVEETAPAEPTKRRGRPKAKGPTVTELRRECGAKGLPWRNYQGLGRYANKEEMIAMLEANA